MPQCAVCKDEAVLRVSFMFIAVRGKEHQRTEEDVCWSCADYLALDAVYTGVTFIGVHQTA